MVPSARRRAADDLGGRQPHGLKPMGLQALDMVRIEAGLIFAGYEFSDQTDPFEAASATVPLKTKSDDFVGRRR
jgi:aminomethyltransferase